jgi:hypothetical protein
LPGVTLAIDVDTLLHGLLQVDCYT